MKRIEENSDTKAPLGISITGKNPALWEKFRSRFMTLCEKVMDFQLDDQNKTTVREEISDFKSKALNYGKAKLERPVLENVEIQARVEKMYAEKVQILTQARISAAEARIAETEADMREYLWKVNQTRYALVALKSMMVGARDDEMIVYSESIDGLLDMLGKIKVDLEDTLGK